MKFETLEAHFRALEAENDARVPAYSWIVARLDGRGFTRLTKRGLDFDKPFDVRFHEAMKTTVAHLCDCGFAVRLAYSQSDEISLLFERTERAFDGKTRKWLSTLAGEASAAFSLELKQIGVFDCRLIVLPDELTVADYFRWRQSDATRNALSAHCYWRLRAQGLTPRVATKQLDGWTPPQKRAWLDEQGVEFDAIAFWQTRGFAAFWESYEKDAFDPRTQTPVVAVRKRLRFETELPDKAEFSDWLRPHL